MAVITSKNLTFKILNKNKFNIELYDLTVERYKTTLNAKEVYSQNSLIEGSLVKSFVELKFLTHSI